MSILIQQQQSMSHQHEWLPVTGSDTLVLIYPTWAGIADFERQIATRLNQQGFSVMLVDIFGQGVALNSMEERRAAMATYLNNRPLLNQSLQAFADFALEQPAAKDKRLMVTGYCFGGLCAMLSALLLPTIEAAASFHGLFKVPLDLTPANPAVRLLILNGYRDPMVPEHEVLAFQRRLDALDLDWVIMHFGKAMHSFTLPAANAPDHGSCYESKAAARAWQALLAFLAESRD
ncbi:dienelactone hydrolase family protein [Candidatus Thalassolituus haligoni]|uniref:dienelactone hydrolase family protein n=1 Tax=Candidatus Thalassolituus haligoni TaxID=3100113 RepID=UPI003511EB02|tara:strand:+ start:2535 stop:3233 length:699 start_codon:yes stop_codon:yes gene_type:complete